MKFILTYKGHEIPSGDPSDIFRLIEILPLTKPEREALWGLWCCADALIDENWSPVSPPFLVFPCFVRAIKDPSFRYGISRNNGELHWEDVIEFCRDHDADLDLIIVPPDEAS